MANSLKENNAKNVITSFNSLSRSTTWSSSQFTEAYTQTHKHKDTHTDTHFSHCPNKRWFLLIGQVEYTQSNCVCQHMASSECTACGFTISVLCTQAHQLSQGACLCETTEKPYTLATETDTSGKHEHLGRGAMCAWRRHSSLTQLKRGWCGLIEAHGNILNEQQSNLRAIHTATIQDDAEDVLALWCTGWYGIDSTPFPTPSDPPILTPGMVTNIAVNMGTMFTWQVGAVVRGWGRGWSPKVQVSHSVFTTSHTGDLVLHAHRRPGVTRTQEAWC